MAIGQEFDLAPQQAIALAHPGRRPAADGRAGEVSSPATAPTSPASPTASRSAALSAARPADHDRRVKLLVLTDEGERMREEITKRLAEPPPRRGHCPKPTSDAEGHPSQGDRFSARSRVGRRSRVRLRARARSQVSEERGLAEVELPIPEPGAGEVVVDVAFCGICGSDLHMLPSPAIAPGTVMGHEFSGRVAALGRGVEGWAAGERVCVLPGTPCGECPNCKAGHEHLCMRGAAARPRPRRRARAPTPSASSSTPTTPLPPARRGLRRARRAGRAACGRRPRRDPRRLATLASPPACSARGRSA